MAEERKRSGSKGLPWWFGIPFLIGGVFVIVLGITLLRDELRYGSEGASVQRTVTETDYSSGGADSGPTWYIGYEFVDPATGQRHGGETDVSEELYDRTSVGDAIEVTYLPAEPTKSRVGSPEPQLFVPSIVIGGGLLFGVVGVGLLALTRWLRRHGPPSWVTVNGDSATLDLAGLTSGPFAGLLAAAELARNDAQAAHGDQPSHAGHEAHVGHGAQAGTVAFAAADEHLGTPARGFEPDVPASLPTPHPPTTPDELKAMDARFAPPKENA